ncbi:ribonuclease H-like domain-containing protein, partial [Tanacetum coccineum]
INKLVKSNLVRGLPSKTFKHDHSCLACRKGKQHKASCKKLEERTVREPLELLHMDLFGPVSVASLNRKKYCLVVTDDCSRFSWVFFLVYKDETYDILHDLIVGLENKLRRKVKTIRTLTPIRVVAERKNRTLIEAGLENHACSSLLPIQFYGLKQYILLVMYKLGGWIFVGLFPTQQRCRVLTIRVTRKVQDCLHVDFLEDQMNQKGKGPDWMFDLDILSPSLNYIPVRKENQVDTAVKQSNSVDFEDVDDQQFIVHGSSSIGNKAVSEAITNDAQNKDSDESTVVKEVPLTIEDQDLQKEFENLMLQEIIAHSHMENQEIASEKRKEKGKEINDLSESDDDLPKDGIFHGNSFDDENKDTEEEIDLDINNMDNTIDVSSSSILRIHKNHPQRQIIGPTASGVKTRKQLQALKMKVGSEATARKNLFSSASRMLGGSDLHRWKSEVQTLGSQYWNDEPIATFKGRTACKVWTLKEALMLFLRGGCELKQWIQQFWNTAKVRMINEVAHIAAKVAGKKILVSEASVRTDLLFNDEDGTML